MNIFLFVAVGAIIIAVYFVWYIIKCDIEKAEDEKRRIREEVERKAQAKAERKAQKEQELLLRNQRYKDAFLQTGLIRKDDFNSENGKYLYEDDINEFLYSIGFKSFAPLSDWLNKKEALETNLNLTIADIKQDRNDKQIIELIIQKKPLPHRIIWNDSFTDNTKNILNIGMGYYGTVGHDLEKYPHSFIAGDTGSGKSNIIKCLVHQALYKGYEVIIIDFKRGVSFANFDDYVEIYYTYETVVKILEDMVEETNRRLDLYRNLKVDNLNSYNRISSKKLKRKVIFIDELAELLKTSDRNISKSLHASIETLTRISRATGINLIMGIQRPDSTVISGQIKSNVSFRVCGHFPDKEPSRIMLGADTAYSLPIEPKGRFLVRDNSIQQVQCFYYPDNANSAVLEKRLNAYKSIEPKETIETPTEEKGQSQVKFVNPFLGNFEVTEKREQGQKRFFDFSDIEKD